jgi:hypothetical protein
MKITYDNDSKMYFITFDPNETVTYINTDDIVEARDEFIEKMKWMFNQAVREKLKRCVLEKATDDSVNKEALTNKTCKTESDHEWECSGISTGGTYYTCKKCHATKHYPPIDPVITTTETVY